jgi:hypothetical protein
MTNGRFFSRSGLGPSLFLLLAMGAASSLSACGDDEGGDGDGGSGGSSGSLSGPSSGPGQGPGQGPGNGGGDPGAGAGSSSGDPTSSSSGIGPGAGGGVNPPPPACDAAPNGGQPAPAAPQLVATLTDRWHEAYLGSPVVADLDADGTKEIVAARDGLVHGWHLDNSIVFAAEVDGRNWAGTVVADLRPEIPGLEVAQSSGDGIFVFDAQGNAVPGFPFHWRGELRSLAAGDIDGDGSLELVAVTTSDLEENGQVDIVIAVHADGSVVGGFPPNTTGASGCDDACYTHAGFDQNVALGDVDGDGVADVAAMQDNAYNSLHKGDGFAFDCAPMFNDRTKFLGVRGLHDYALAQQGYGDDSALQAHHTNTAPAIADIDGDGVGELVFTASVQDIGQSNYEMGVALWVLKPDGTRPAAWTEPFYVPTFLSGQWDYGENMVAITNQVTVADMFPDRPGPEMIFAGFDGRIHAVDSARQEIWSFAYTTRDDQGTGGVLVVDLSGDGVPEVIFASYAMASDVSSLFVLDAGGNVVSTTPIPGRGSMAVPTIDDVEGDGQLEILLNLKGEQDDDGDPQVVVYTVPGSSPNCMLWPTGRANYRRDGWIVPG